VHAQDEHGHARLGLFDFAKNFQTAAPGHGDIEDDDVPMLLPNEVKSLLRVAGLTERRPLELIGEDLFQAVPHYGVIVG
jgi:hypothetical protein